MDDFYVTLPSNAYKEFYTDNTLSHYRTKLTREMRLGGGWEVGLSDIILPKAFIIPSQEIEVTNTHRVTVKCQTEPDHYRTNKEFLDHLNRLMEGLKEDLEEVRTNPFRLKSLANGYVRATLMPANTVKLTDELAGILGFSQSQVDEMKVSVNKFRYYTASNKCRVTCIPLFYIYTDIIEPGLVGDGLARLLDIIPANEQDVGPVISRRMDRPRYVPVQWSSIASIKIEIMSGFNRYIQFIESVADHVIVKLHFRKVY